MIDNCRLLTDNLANDESESEYDNWYLRHRFTPRCQWDEQGCSWSRHAGIDRMTEGMNTGNVVGIEYGLPIASEAEAMAGLLAKAFSRRDPPAYAVGITAEEFEVFTRLLCPKAITDELTIVARRADTSELVGVMLNEDCASPMPEGIERLSRKFDPILDILGQLSAEYWRDRSACPGESVHLFLLGVAEEAAGKGLAQQLVTRTLQHCVFKGCRHAVTEATNKVSQHVFRKLGFVERVRRSYADHRFEGRACFASIAEHGGPTLMDWSPVSG